MSAGGWVVAGTRLVWLLHDVHPRAILASAGRLSWAWVTLGVAFDILSYIAQGWRWELLLRARGRLSVWRTTQAIYAGLFTNEVVPMRAGELVRMGLAARWLNTPARAVFPSLLLERLMDGFWLAAATGTAALFVPLPDSMRIAAGVLGAVVLLGFGFLQWVSRRPAGGPHTGRFGAILRWLEPIQESIRNSGRSRDFRTAIIASGLVLLGQILAFWSIMQAAGMGLGFGAGAVVLLIVHLGTMIPNAPANLGSYQFFVVVGLAVFGVDKTSATAFSFVVFLLLTAPLWIIGSFALSRSGMTIASASRRARDAGHPQSTASDVAPIRDSEETGDWRTMNLSRNEPAR
jgi:uncharacterized membrane protein YbhN (UPF0104 family)